MVPSAAHRSAVRLAHRSPVARRNGRPPPGTPGGVSGPRRSLPGPSSEPFPGARQPVVGAALAAWTMSTPAHASARRCVPTTRRMIWPAEATG